MKLLAGYRVYKIGTHTIPVHRILMEIHLNRRLYRDEVVHHINGDKLDNRIENLRVMKNSEHAALHNSKEFYRNNGIENLHRIYAETYGW